MNNIASYSIPLFICVILLTALIKRVNIWSQFTKGGTKGLKCAFDIMPSLVGLVTAIELLSASGVLSSVSSFFAPLCNILGIPNEILPLSFMRSVSGSGSIALFQNLLSQHSPDSYIGRTASVIMGSTETTFYTLSVYFAATRAKSVRYCVICALLADLTGSIVGSLLCRYI